MSALTAWRKIEHEGDVEFLECELAANDTYYEGGVLCADANGYAAAVGADDATTIPLGVFDGRMSYGTPDGEMVVHEKAVAAATYPKARIRRGRLWIPYSGAAQTDVFDLFYCSDDGTLTGTAGSKKFGVLCVGWKSGYLLLDFAHPIYK